MATNHIFTQVANDIFKTNSKEIADFISSQPTAACINDVYITLIICITIALCVLIITCGIRAGIKHTCDAKLEEQKCRQEFEKDKIRLEKETMEAKWKREDDVRNLEHSWKDKKRENNQDKESK